MFHIVGDKLNQCPRSEQAATDRLFAHAIAVLARTYVLLKTLGISFITSLGGYYQTVFCQTPTALPVKKQKFCACCSPPPGKCMSYVLLPVLPYQHKGRGSLAGF